MKRPPTYKAVEVKTRALHVYTEMHVFPTQATRLAWIDDSPHTRHKLTSSRAREESELAEDVIIHMTAEETRSRGR